MTDPTNEAPPGPEFIPPPEDEPIPEPSPEGTDYGLGGREVPPDEMDDAERAFIGGLLGDLPAARTMAAAAPAGAPTWARVYALAKSFLAAVVAGRRKENVNPFTIWYYGTPSIAAAWCFIFISYVLAHAAETAQAGLSLIGGKKAYVPKIREIPGYGGGHSGMRVGAIVAINDFSHIGFCTYVSGSTFHLLSGNSASSAGGDAVTVRSYSVGIVSGHVNLNYATATSGPSSPVVPAGTAARDDGSCWIG